MLNQINKYTNLFFSDLFEFMCVFFYSNLFIGALFDVISVFIYFLVENR